MRNSLKVVCCVPLAKPDRLFFIVYFSVKVLHQQLFKNLQGLTNSILTLTNDLLCRYIRLEHRSLPRTNDQGCGIDVSGSQYTPVTLYYFYAL